MSSRRIVKSKENLYTIHTVEYPLLNGDRDFFDHGDADSDNQDEENPFPIPLETMNQLKPYLEAIIKDSEDKARDIIQKAHLEAAALEEKARISGYEAGYENATKEIQQAIESLSKILKQGMDDISSLKQRILNQAEPDIVHLAIEIARKLACRELKQHPDTIVSIVEKAIEIARNKSGIIIKVHPDDYNILKQHVSQLVSQISEDHTINDNKPELYASPLKLEADPELSPGGCIVVTDTNLIDMTLETRMELLDNRSIGQ